MYADLNNAVRYIPHCINTKCPYCDKGLCQKRTIKPVTWYGKKVQNAEVVSAHVGQNYLEHGILLTFEDGSEDEVYISLCDCKEGYQCFRPEIKFAATCEKKNCPDCKNGKCEKINQLKAGDKLYVALPRHTGYEAFMKDEPVLEAEIKTLVFTKDNLFYTTAIETEDGPFFNTCSPCIIDKKEVFPEQDMNCVFSDKNNALQYALKIRS